MKIELNLDDNRYIKLINDLNELEEKHKEISKIYNEVTSIIENNNYESDNINKKIAYNTNKINKMIEEVKIKPLTIKNIITDEILLISMISLYFGIQSNDPMFALYGFSAFAGISFLSARIVEKNENKKKDKIIKSKDYCQVEKEIKELTKEKEKRIIINNKLKLKYNILKEEKESIEYEIDNKKEDIILFINNIYNEVDNILEETTKTSGQHKTRIRNIKEEKSKE